MSGVDAGQAGTGGQGQDDKTKGDAGQTGGTSNADAGQTGGNDTQKAIDAVVSRERQRAERERAELQRQIDELRAAAPKAKPAEDEAKLREYAETVRKPIEEKLTKAEEKLTATEKRLTRSELKAAAADSVDPDEIADRLDGQVKMTEAGTFEVIGKDGNPRYSANGAMTVQELVAELLAAKPYLAKSTARNGADFNGSRTHAVGDIDAQIADAEKAGNWASAQRLKAQKLKAPAA
jgi:hypothetical protein